VRDDLFVTNLIEVRCNMCLHVWNFHPEALVKLRESGESSICPECGNLMDDLQTGAPDGTLFVYDDWPWRDS